MSKFWIAMIWRKNTKLVVKKLPKKKSQFMKWLKANYGLEVKDLDLEQYVKLSREFNNENPDPEET